MIAGSFGAAAAAWASSEKSREWASEPATICAGRGEISSTQAGRGMFMMDIAEATFQPPFAFSDRG